MRLLRKIFIFLFVLAAIYALLFTAVNFIFQKKIKVFLERKLGVYSNIQADIAGFKTNLLTQAKINGIRIKLKAALPGYLNISSVNLRYRPLYFFRNRFIGRIEVKGLHMSLGDIEFQEDIAMSFSLRPTRFYKALEIEEAAVYLKGAPALKIKGAFEPVFKPKSANLHAEVPSLSDSSFDLKDLNLNFKFSGGESFGDFLAAALSYNNFRLGGIKSEFRIKDRRVHFDDFKADIFGGKIKGFLAVSFLPDLNCDVNLSLAGLNLKDISSALAPKDWRATGIVSGNLKLVTQGEDLKDLQGRLYSEGAGTLAMKAIKRLFSRASVIIDSRLLKEDVFTYANLTADISLLKDNIIVKLALLGEEAELRFDINIEPEVLVSLLLKPEVGR